MTTLLLASRSAHKVREIGEILGAGSLHILSLAEAGIPEAPDEDGIEVFETFLGNARAKADWFGTRTRRPVLADDSGICVDALGGAPGVRSKRFAGRADLSGNDLDHTNNRTLLDRLRDAAPAKRGAAYVCAAVVRYPDGRMIESVGSVRGRILEAPRGQGGFGYDPLFFLPDIGHTFGELDDATKHRFSHRARAFRALAPHLR